LPLGIIVSMRILMVLAVIAFVAAGCGGDSEPIGTRTAFVADGTPGGTPSPSASSTIGGSDRTEDETKVEAAVREILKAEPRSTCPDPSIAPPTACATTTSTQETLLGGISVWQVFSVDGAGATVKVLGRNVDGDWMFWFSRQPEYQLTTLPGNVRVCAEGDGLRLRQLPVTTANVAASLADDAVVEVDKFVLTEPGNNIEGQVSSGFGWYHVKTSPDGWAYSKDLSAATLPDCSLRNATEGGAPPPAATPAATP
jgi:hypothetical protein